MKKLALLFFLLGYVEITAYSQQMHKAPAPLFRDPIYDGAADPVVVYNRAKKQWWMFYTQRRANVQVANVGWCYGTSIGVAVTEDHGQTWNYHGAPKLEFEEGVNTFWAPDIFYEKGIYHMFVAYIRGVHNNWGGKARIVHFTSKDLWNWTFKDSLKLASDNVIDPTFLKLPDGKWHVWYKDDYHSITMTAESDDLVHWKSAEKPAIGGAPHEGPKIFQFAGSYWMITDEWHGQRVYRSKDAATWEKQGLILDKRSAVIGPPSKIAQFPHKANVGPSDEPPAAVPGVRPDDSPTGAHADVVVVGNKSYIFYFTHPGRKTHFEASLDKDGDYPYSEKRSSIQVAELVYKDGTLVAVRDEPFDFWLPDLN